MNIVRRLLSSSGGSTDSQNETETERVPNLARQESTIKTPEQELLGLSHLKKLHLDYTTSEISPQEKETKLYAMLPLFCNIFSSVGHKVISEKFAEDIIPFTQATSEYIYLLNIFRYVRVLLLAKHTENFQLSVSIFVFDGSKRNFLQIFFLRYAS